MPRLSRLLIIAGILVAMLPFVGCIGRGTGPVPAGELAVLDQELVRGESGDVAVRVTVKNVGTVVAELARVTVNFYDADKGLIDSSSDSVMNLAPGETWDFEIACEGKRAGSVSSYEIETMTGTSSGGF